MLYPLKFKPILKETVWGGNRLANKSNTHNPDATIGESWEISGIQDNQSVVAEGPLADNTLEELIEVYMGDLVGDHVYDKFGIEFPLLIKYIDARQNLSIQVHPDDATAKERHHAYGKTEMWYLIDAAPDASLILGFKHDTTSSEYLTHLHAGTLPQLLRTEHVERGDCFFIPAGTVHAINAGCFIAEIQQTSDVTYRLFDYNRLDRNGSPRELHTDLATDIINYHAEECRIPYHNHLNHSKELVDCKYFTTNYLKFNQEVEKDYIESDSFIIYLCLSGQFTLVYDIDQSVKIRAGETVLIPACLKNIFLIPDHEAEILEVYIS